MLFTLSVYITLHSNISIHQNHLQGLLKHRVLDPTPTISYLAGLEGVPRMGVANRFLGDASASGPRSYFKNH